MFCDQVKLSIQSYVIDKKLFIDNNQLIEKFSLMFCDQSFEIDICHRRFTIL